VFVAALSGVTAGDIAAAVASKSPGFFSLVTGAVTLILVLPELGPAFCGTGSFPAPGKHCAASEPTGFASFLELESSPAAGTAGTGICRFV
jgi:hypothetical protein